MKTIESQVVIIGAGMAGLAAAQVLGKRGVSCTLLEAAPHVGGRIRTLWREGWPLPIELGAEFVHGLPAPTLALGKMRVQLQEVPDVRLQMGGSVVRMPAVWARYAQLLKPALRDADLAQSVCDYMATPEFDDKQREFVRLLVEGYHAAPLADTSAAAVARDAAALGADFKQYRLERGQQQLVELVLEQLRLSSPRVELNTRVQRVQWTKNEAIVLASQGEEAVQVRAKCCLVTCSIGVLQLEADEGGIEFSPYPETLRTHLSGLAMGNVVKVVLRFSRRIWPAHPNAADATFLHVPDALFATYWRQSIGKHEQVTAWAGGPPSLELSRLGAEQVAEHALGCFARLVGEDPALVRAALIEAHHHDFIGDPFSCGAYSYVRPGGEQAARALSQPLQDTLFFAGEALDLEFPATVAGALGSGQHAARKILTVLAPRQIQSGAAPVMGK